MDSLKLINIGFGSMAAAGRMVAAISPDSAQVKRMIQDSRERGNLIDATYGRRTRAVLVMDSGHVILSAVPPETIAGRMAGRAEKTTGDEDRDEE